MLPDDIVVRSGKVFEVGSYPDKNFALNDQEATAAVASFQPLPANVEHRPSPLDGALGGLQRMWKEGTQLFAESYIPQWLDSHLRTKGVPLQPSLEWDRETKQVKGVAWVNFPRIEDAALMSAFSADVIDDPAIFWVDPIEHQEGYSADFDFQNSHVETSMGNEPTSASRSRSSSGKYHPASGSDKHPFLRAMDDAEGHLDKGNKLAAANTLYKAWDAVPNHPATEHSNLASLKSHQNEPDSVIKSLIHKAREVFVGRTSKTAAMSADPDLSRHLTVLYDGIVPFKSEVPTPEIWSAGDPPTGFPTEEPKPGTPHVAKIGGVTKTIGQNEPIDGKHYMAAAQTLLQVLQMNPGDTLLQKLVMEYTKKASTGVQSFIVGHGKKTDNGQPMETYHNSYEDAVNAAQQNSDEGEADNLDNELDSDEDDGANMSLHSYLTSLQGDVAYFDMSQAARDNVDNGDFAGPHRSFPINSPAHIKSAARLIGHAADPGAVKSAIIRIAKRKGWEGHLPESWKSDGGENANMSRNHVKELHDHSVSCGAECAGDGMFSTSGADIAKFMTPEQLKTIQKVHDVTMADGTHCYKMEGGTEHADYSVSPGKRAVFAHILSQSAATTRQKGPNTMSRFGDKIKALFGLAGVPQEHIDQLTDADIADIIHEEAKEVAPDFSQSAEFTAMKQENERLQELLEDQKEASAEFSRKFAEQEASAIFTQNCAELDKLSAMPFAKITPDEAVEYAKIAKQDAEAFALVLPILQSKPVLAQFSKDDTRNFQRMGGASEADNPAKSLEIKTKERMASTKEPYHVAFGIVCSENPELAHAQFTAGGN